MFLSLKSQLKLIGQVMLQMNQYVDLIIIMIFRGHIWKEGSNILTSQEILHTKQLIM